jgi:hypothetical protein
MVFKIGFNIRPVFPLYMPLPILCSLLVSPNKISPRLCTAVILKFLIARKVAGSIRDGVIGIFHSRNRSGRAMALRSTQPLTEMSTRCISWG